MNIRTRSAVAVLGLAVLIPGIAGCTTFDSSAGTVSVGELDGVLDCPDNSSWSLQGALDPELKGAPTAEAALREALAPYADKHTFNGPMVLVNDSIASLTDRAGEAVIASVVEVSPGNWVLGSVQGCGRYALR